MFLRVILEISFVDIHRLNQFLYKTAMQCAHVKSIERLVISKKYLISYKICIHTFVCYYNIQTFICVML